VGTDYAKALLVAVTMSKVHFDKEIAERRERLTIRYQWFRLYQHYQAVRARHLRRFGKEPKRRIISVEPQEGEWRNLWQYEINGGRQRPVSNIYNALVALRHHIQLQGIVATYEPTGKLMLRHPLPFEFWDKGLVEWEDRPFLKLDATAVHEFLQSIGLVRLTAEDCASAIKKVAHENRWGGS
jgi:hypothetical protein